MLIGGPPVSANVKRLAANLDTAPVTVEIGPMSKAEARRETDAAKQVAEDLWRRLYVLHEREAWSALGYESWAAYLRTEFDMSKRRANQLVDHGRFVIAIEAGQQGTVVPFYDVPTEGATRAVRSDPGKVARVRRAVAQGVSPIEAVKRALPPKATKRTRDPATGAACEHEPVTVVVCKNCGKRLT